VAETFEDVIAFEQTDFHIEMLTALPIAHYALPIVSQRRWAFHLPINAQCVMGKWQ
jgi:hypothetical protein